MRCGPDHSDEESFYADSTFEELQVKKSYEAEFWIRIRSSRKELHPPFESFSLLI